MVLRDHNFGSMETLNKYIDMEIERGHTICCPEAKELAHRTDDWKCFDFCPFPFCIQSEIESSNGKTKPAIIKAIRKGFNVELVDGRAVISPPKTMPMPLFATSALNGRTFP